MNTGICGKCGEIVRSINVEDAAMTIEGTATVLRTVTYRCSKCQAVLGIQDDPHVTARELEVIKEELGKVKKDLAESLQHQRIAAHARQH
jgi:DNA-directed RNA polymerase subunit RPC12/RpoP